MVLVKARMESVPAKDRKRVVRVMAADELSCPGDDSFQNEVITAAGGIVPRWGKDGFAVAVDLEEWKDFDPQFIYGCHLNEKAVRSLLGREGWRDVDAVRTGSVAMFPCDLTCRVSTRVGAFVQWMAAVIYPDIFADPERAVLQNSVLERKPIALDSAYVEKAEVVKHRVADAEFKSLVLRFKRPQAALSTFEGFLSDIEAVGNTYIPMHASLGHMAYGVDRARKDIAKNLGYDEGKYSGLMTGANMDNLSVQKRTFEDLEATAFVTAGVRGNAMRMSKDSGIYCKPGTINIIVLTNRRLTPNAMARTIITATEAKSAALLDLDIRSSYNRDFRATGTGTDNVMIVQGEGPEERLAGGHDKIAELVAKAVHAGVTEAIARQNGIKADRDLFQRLEDRRLNLDRVVRCYRGDDTAKSLSSELRKILEVPYYASFIESAFAISDDYEKGLIKEPDFFDDACCLVAARLSKRPEFSLNKIPVPDGLPTIMAKAFGALIAGISEKDGDSDNRGEH
jgi:adenosylcobinamide amidohydrolase